MELVTHGRVRATRIVAVGFFVTGVVALGSSVFRAPHHLQLAALGFLSLAMLVGVLSLSQRDGVALLTLMAGCLFLIPENLVLVGPLRSVGNPAQLTGLFCLALWAAARLLGLIEARAMHPVRWAIMIFTLANLTAYVAGQLRPLSALEGAATTRTVFLMASAVGIAIMATDGIGTHDRLATMMARLVLIAGVAAFIGILEFAVSSFHYREQFHVPVLTATVDILDETRGDFARISGAAAHPIEYAVALAALAPLALHLALSAADSGVRKRSMLAFICIVTVVPMSVSRAGLMAIAVGMVVYAAHLSARARINFVIIGIVGLLLFRSAVPGLLGTLRYLLTVGGQDSSISARTDDYARIPGLMSGSWWFGRGLGTFVPHEYFFLDNQYLGSLLEGGIVGLAAFTILGATGVCAARGGRHRSGEALERGLGQALAGGIAALMASAAAFDALSFRQVGFTLMLLVGLAGCLWSLQHDQPRRWRNGTLRAPVAGQLDVAESTPEPRAVNR